VIHLLDAFGPQVGLPTLRHCFPRMTRAELTDLVQRYRRVWRKRHRVPLHVLHWSTPGRVWAIDSTEAPAATDGGAHLLAVRDLATGMQLLWQPIAAATGAQAAQALATLFATHGAPLVLKSDNGGPFTSALVQNLLQAHGVASLLSPPHWPRYNGAIEAGIGALNDRTAARAARAGHPGYWTTDDMAGARAEANTLARPFGPTGPSPTQAWATRTPIIDDERARFQASVQHHTAAVDPCAAQADDVWSRRAMARQAIQHALAERGYLQVTWRTIPLPIPGPKVARIP
jgi:transposase InsO family protein